MSKKDTGLNEAICDESLIADQDELVRYQKKYYCKKHGIIEEIISTHGDLAKRFFKKDEVSFCMSCMIENILIPNCEQVKEIKKDEDV